MIQRVENAGADYYSSDCPMAGHQIESGLEPRAREPDASAEAAAPRLRNLKHSPRPAMQKLAATQI